MTTKKKLGVDSIPADMIQFQGLKVGDVVSAPGIPVGTPITPIEYPATTTGPSVGYVGYVTCRKPPLATICYICHREVTLDEPVMTLHSISNTMPGIDMHQTCVMKQTENFDLIDPDLHKRQIVQESQETYQRYKDRLNGDDAA